MEQRLLMKAIKMRVQSDFQRLAIWSENEVTGRVTGLHLA